MGFCLQQVCDNPDHLFKSTKFLSFNPSILEIILKRDDFFCNNEITIWENLLKWTCCQNPVIQQDINKWSENEFTVMERRLSRFISSIRFYHISSEDFLLKVYPFKKLLPNDIINNIFAYHMTPNNRQNIDTQPHRKIRYDSSIITFQHFDIFASWIDKKNGSYYNERNIPYNFNLLYRASRDGNTTAAFHDKCDNKGATIVVVKIRKSEKIFGGYNPLNWDSSGSWKSTHDSFKFSFTNRDDAQSAKVGYSYGDATSVYCHPSFGPVFGGVGFDGSDCKWYRRQCFSYSCVRIPPDRISADDYEVFQVIKR